MLFALINQKWLQTNFREKHKYVIYRPLSVRITKNFAQTVACCSSPSGSFKTLGKVFLNANLPVGKKQIYFICKQNLVCWLYDRGRTAFYWFSYPYFCYLPEPVAQMALIPLELRSSAPSASQVTLVWMSLKDQWPVLLESSVRRTLKSASFVSLESSVLTQQVTHHILQTIWLTITKGLGFFIYPQQRMAPTLQLQINILIFSTPTFFPQCLFTNYSMQMPKFTPSQYSTHNTFLS